MAMKEMLGLGLRGLEFLWALLIMALVGNMIAMGAHPAVVNYTMFCAAFAMLSLFYLIPATVSDSFKIMSFLPFALDLLLTLFWFCAAVAMAAELGVHSCSRDSYVGSNHVIRGASNQHGACREAQASTAFLWFGFAAFVASAAFTGMGMGGGSAPRGGIRRGPAMSQV